MFFRRQAYRVGTWYAPTVTPIAHDASLSKRAAQIRRQETVFRWLRRLVIPAFTVYGLVILRPTEGHFLRYLAERRHLEPTFNSLFPPLPQEKTTPAIVAKKNVQDDRLERRRRLFVRETKFVASEEDEESPSRSALADSSTEDHPPMHLLRQQLDKIMEDSKAYKQSSSSGTTVDPPTVLIQFRDNWLFATSQLTLHNSRGEAVYHLRFVGFCGMLWKQIN
ncbi:hypothetical protein, conserved [Angomonas deanei]|uniref:Uncharacterized protein n=1 Tax=Angomonas deanei TaxID=59799 RepID=A0A7G2CKD0_9TRYP|nr:hypothetical protein, conserved [Angomonas deanei]